MQQKNALSSSRKQRHQEQVLLAVPQQHRRDCQHNNCNKTNCCHQRLGMWATTSTASRPLLRSSSNRGEIKEGAYWAPPGDKSSPHGPLRNQQQQRLVVVARDYPQRVRARIPLARTHLRPPTRLAQGLALMRLPPTCRERQALRAAAAAVVVVMVVARRGHVLSRLCREGTDMGTGQT